MRYFIQYHNYEGQGGYPAQGSPNMKLSEFTHTISSKKKHYVLNSVNDKVFLILGKKLNKNEKKKYFLWSESLIDDFDKEPDKNGWYEMHSERQSYLCPPQYINDLNGFNELITKSSNFSLGLMDISEWKILNQFINLCNIHKCKNLDEITWKQHIDLFERETLKRFRR